MSVSKYLDPQRYLQRLRKHRALRAYDLPRIEAEENEKFHRLGLDPVAARPHLDAALSEIGSAPYDDLSGTDSVHWLVFAALSLTDRGKDISRILEIGTFRGKTALLLKTLFPAATVTTVDLPVSDPIMRSTYRRGSEAGLREYQDVRDGRVSRPGIDFVEANSFFLPQHVSPPFDLIWMDGGHLFPEVAWDFCNAWHLCRPGGIVMCDDIIPDPRGRDPYASDESHRVIQYIAARTRIEPVYLLKRRNPVWSADPRTRKFVAWIDRP